MQFPLPEHRVMETPRSDPPMVLASFPPGPASAVLAWVDGSPERAEAAMAGERLRDQPRKTLLAKLERIAGGTD